MRDPLEGAVPVTDPLTTALSVAPSPPRQRKPRVPAPQSFLSQIFEGVGKPLQYAGEEVSGFLGMFPTAYRAAKEIDWPGVTGREVGSAGMETLRQLLGQAEPIALGAIGAAGGPGTAVAGYLGGRLLQESRKQLETGVPQAPEETFSRVLGSVPLAAAATYAPAMGAKVVGYGPKRLHPGRVSAFKETGVTPTFGDVALSDVAGKIEALTGRSFGGIKKIQSVQEPQFRQAGQAVGDAFERMGGVVPRAQIEKLVTPALETQLVRTEGIYQRLKAKVPKDVFVPNLKLADKARDLLTEVTRLAEANPQMAKAFEALTKELRPLATSKGRLFTFEQWDALQRRVGELGRTSEVIAPGLKGKYKALTEATQKDLASVAKLHRTVRRAAEFYKEYVAPITKTEVGRYAAGKISPEDAGKVLTKRGLTEITDLRKFAPEAFIPVRNRFLADMFERAGVVLPDGSLNPRSYVRAWRSIDPEVKANLFRKDPAALRFLNQLDTVAERMSGKPLPGQTGPQIPLGQYAAAMAAVSAIPATLTGIFTGSGLRGGMAGVGTFASLAGLSRLGAGWASKVRQWRGQTTAETRKLSTLAPLYRMLSPEEGEQPTD